MIKKSQTSVEVIVISAILLIIFMIFFFANADMSSMFSSRHDNEKARLALDEIAHAANIVYNQGVGASKVVFINIPSGIKNSSIQDRTLTYELYPITNTDNTYEIYSIVNFNISGDLPIQKGNYRMIVRSEEGFVNVSQNQ